MVQGDVPAHHVVVGTPANSVKIKPGWEAVAEPIDDGRLPNRQDGREINHEIDDEVAIFDEFQRTLSPPDAPPARE